MKQLFTLALAFACLSAHSQSGLMPYNPDSNGDALIGSEDLISILGVYNTLMIDSSLTCDYQGTELETLLGGLFSGNLVLDSVYLEYLLIDSVLTYLPECPDPIFVNVVLERAFMLPMYSEIQSAWPSISGGNNYLGFSRTLQFQYYSAIGGFHLVYYDYEVPFLTNYPHYSYSDGCPNSPNYCTNFYLPFPDDYWLDGDGISIPWTEESFISHCEHFRLIPYWHEAE